MKNTIRLITAGVLLASAVFAAPAFEGKVNFKVTEGKKSTEMNYSIKGDKIRIDVPAEKDMGGMIVDLGKKEMMMLMPAEKMYMTMPVPDAATESAQKKADETTLEKTGETEKILGYTATKYIATDKKKGTSSDLWLAEGMGTFMAMSKGSPMGGRGSDSSGKNWEKVLAGKELFPLRVVEKNKAGKEVSRMEVTAVEKKSLPDSVFAAPDGYQKFDMGGMMKGMIPGFGK